jgi:hypothetical protein
VPLEVAHDAVHRKRVVRGDQPLGTVLYRGLRYVDGDVAAAEAEVQHGSKQGGGLAGGSGPELHDLGGLNELDDPCTGRIEDVLLDLRRVVLG